MKIGITAMENIIARAEQVFEYATVNTWAIRNTVEAKSRMCLVFGILDISLIKVR